MRLKECGVASQRRARWIFVEVLLALRAAAHQLREVRRLCRFIIKWPGPGLGSFFFQSRLCLPSLS